MLKFNFSNSNFSLFNIKNKFYSNNLSELIINRNNNNNLLYNKYSIKYFTKKANKKNTEDLADKHNSNKKITKKKINDIKLNKTDDKNKKNEISSEENDKKNIQNTKIKKLEKLEKENKNPNNTAEVIDESTLKCMIIHPVFAERYFFNLYNFN